MGGLRKVQTDCLNGKEKFSSPLFQLIWSHWRRALAAAAVKVESFSFD
jgi:hypothetical protein